ncbi:MAG: transglycosylase SLT domain-containing protein [Methylococcales symbiont of Iophon sp. n. MRB-2018]|nr:MAG: transglycosylase SLT domain-containing protein [Methylococcales symbiont of Iophon sp. n. MRB-2018]KAF3980725.1 MAG: transglycosylase SLT domain-containing protein [Methylococcales symbiont of Iophon sp. n. MRB-2018]
MLRKLLSFCIILLLCACTTTAPKRTNNICEIFKEKNDWYSDVKQAEKNWGVPIHVIMAIIHQESRFVADAQPPRPWLLGIIPWFRSSSAYGYAQAQKGTWQDYLNNGGHWGGDRDDFYDASDFVGWYCHNSHDKLAISKWDTEKLYLAYHEGLGGFKRQTYLKKPWLIGVSKKVKKRGDLFRVQLTTCKEDLENRGWFF